MYVITRPTRMAGYHIPAGTILPDDMRVPGHLVTSGIAVLLPETLTPWHEAIGAEEEQEPEPVPEPEEEPVHDSEPEEDLVEVNEVEIEHYHVGGGYYEFPDGSRIRGKQNAQDELKRRMEIVDA